MIPTCQSLVINCINNDLFIFKLLFKIHQNSIGICNFILNNLKTKLVFAISNNKIVFSAEIFNLKQTSLSRNSPALVEAQPSSEAGTSFLVQQGIGTGRSI